MKNVRWIILSMLICGLCASQAIAVNVACGPTGYKHNTSTIALKAHPGDVIDYVVSVTVPADQYPIHDGVVTLALPDGTHVTLDTGLSLGVGETKNYPASGLPPVPANQQYTVNIADEGKNGALAGWINAEANCVATAQIDPETTAPASGTGNWPTQIIEPNICVSKTVTPQTAFPGQQVVFHIQVCNCGNTTLTRYSVIDTNTIPSDITSSLPLTLTAGQCSNVIDIPTTIPIDVDANNPFCNTVTADYNDVLGLHVQDSNTACVTLIKPGLTVIKSCPEWSKVGDKAHYCVEMTNTTVGHNLIVDSIVDDHNGTIPVGSCGTLVPNVPCTVCYDYVVKNADDSGQPGAILTNKVTVTTHVEGFPPTDANAQVVRDSDCTVKLVHPSFTASKVCEPETVSGDTAQYRIIITNTGDVPLLIHVDDPNISPAIPDQQLSNVPLLNVINQLVTMTLQPGATEACNRLKVTATLPESYGLANSYDFDSGPICCTVPGLEGCTLGFWKTNTDCWCEQYHPGDLLSSVFDFSTADGVPSDVNKLGNKTLLQALKFKGGSSLTGKAQNMLRQAVAALLNSCNENVQFPLNTTAVIDKVNDALINTFKLGTLQSELEDDNMLGCPINADNARCPCCRKTPL